MYIWTIEEAIRRSKALEEDDMEALRFVMIVFSQFNVFPCISGWFYLVGWTVMSLIFLYFIGVIISIIEQIDVQSSVFLLN